MAELLKQKNSPYWYIRYTDDIGKRRKFSSKTKNKSMALKIKNDYEAQEMAIKHGIVEKKKKKSDISLNNAINDFLDDKKISGLAIGTIKNYRLALVNLQDALGSLTSIYKIGPTDRPVIRRYFRKTLRLNPQGTNIRLRSIKVFMRWLVKNGFLDKVPFEIDRDTFIKIKDVDKKPRFLMPGEFEKVMDEFVNDNMKAYCRLAFRLGLRLGEIPTAKLITPKRLRVIGKGDKDRTLPFPEDLLSDLETVQNTNYNTDSVSWSWSQAAKKSGVLKPCTCGKSDWSEFAKSDPCPYCKKPFDRNGNGKTFHSLRHTFACRMIGKGVSLLVVRDLLGHTTVKTTEDYLTWGQDYLIELFSDGNGVNWLYDALSDPNWYQNSTTIESASA
jgi:integrase/recombinase XerD